MTSRLAAGDSKEQSATFAYKTLAFPMLTGSFVTAAGFVRAIPFDVDAADALGVPSGPARGLHVRDAPMAGPEHAQERLFHKLVE